jgi:hypothetical protein
MKAAPTKATPTKATPVEAAPAKIVPTKVTPAKKAAPKKKSTGLELFVCRSGPRRGDAQLEAAFRTKPEAVAFLANVHGLATDEQKALSREGKLALDPRVHGSEICAIKAVKMPPPDAAKALSGDLYL